MAADAATQMGGGTDLANTVGLQDQSTGGNADTPQQAITGAIQQVSRYQKNLSEIRQGAQALSTQFPANGKTMAQVSDMVDQLQKLLASYMSDVVKANAPTTDAGSSLSGLLR